MMPSMAFSDVKKFVSSWPREMVGLAVLVSAVLLLLWQLGQVTFVQIITGLLVLAGLYWTSRRVLAAEETVRVAEEGQITERFTRAIDQLGQEGEGKMAIRLGGIYALERIAKDSEKDHGPIMEVLTAYVREKASKQGKSAEEAAAKPPTDIQAILTVLGRRKTTGKNRGNAPLDLSHTRLVRADLTDANLSGAILVGANLSGAFLVEANLCKAKLLGARLTTAKNLTAEQVQEAYTYRGAHLPDHLEHLIPSD